MTRVYANNNELLTVARYFISKGVTDIKAELLKSNYQVKLDGNVRNVDYKLVEAMMFALTATSSPSSKSSPRARRKPKSLPDVAVQE